MKDEGFERYHLNIFKSYPSSFILAFVCMSVKTGV
jgi:hypothetical protein